MNETENVINLTNDEIIAKHIRYLCSIGLHCSLFETEENHTEGRFIEVIDDRIRINLLTSDDFLPKENTEIEVKYHIDSILHKFSSKFANRENDNVYLLKPEEIMRFQLRRYKRVETKGHQELKVHFDFCDTNKDVKEITDIGEGGMGIELHRLSPKIQKNIRINSLKLMLKDSETLHLSGKLRYIRPEDEEKDPSYRIGIEFDPLKENDRITLLDFLDELDKD